MSWVIRTVANRLSELFEHWGLTGHGFQGRTSASKNLPLFNHPTEVRTPLYEILRHVLWTGLQGSKKGADTASPAALG